MAKPIILKTASKGKLQTISQYQSIKNKSKPRFPKTLPKVKSILTPPPPPPPPHKHKKQKKKKKKKGEGK